MLKIGSPASRHYYRDDVVDDENQDEIHDSNPRMSVSCRKWPASLEHVEAISN